MKKARPKRLGSGRRARAVKFVPVPARPFTQHSFEGRIEFLNGGGVPTVFMTREVYSRMWHFVDIAPKEVGWFGTVRITPSGNYLIEEVFLLEQEVSSIETELSGEGQALLAQHLIETRPDGVEVTNRLRFWGHSHVNMGTSPSPQDDTQMKKFRENGCPWFIRGILNKLGRMEFSIFLWEAGAKIMDAPWAIYEHIDQSMRGEIETEFKDKVSQKTYPVHVLPADVGAVGPYRFAHLALANALAVQAGSQGIVIRPGGAAEVGRRDYFDDPDDDGSGGGISHVS